MLTHDARAQIPLWKARKAAQWERIAGNLPGLQLVRYGEMGSSCMLTYSVEGFYESILIGRLPQQIKRPARGPRPAETVITETLIDLTDDQIDVVLACWQQKRSAAGLPFIEAVWGRDGKRHGS